MKTVKDSQVDEPKDPDNLYQRAVTLLNGLIPPADELPLEYKKGCRRNGDYGVEEAFRLFHSAAEQEHVKAQRELALCYLNGRGSRKNTRLFLKWITRAAESGDVHAQTSLGVYYDWPPGNEDKAEFWLQKAANQGHGWSCYLFAQYRLVGNEKGHGKYTAEGAEFLRRGAVASIGQCPETHVQLGRCLAVGEGVPQNKVEAFAWLAVAKAEDWYGWQDPMQELIPKMTPSEIAEGKVLAEEYIPRYRCYHDQGYFS